MLSGRSIQPWSSGPIIWFLQFVKAVSIVTTLEQAMQAVEIDVSLITPNNKPQLLHSDKHWSTMTCCTRQTLQSTSDGAESLQMCSEPFSVDFWCIKTMLTKLILRDRNWWYLAKVGVGGDGDFDCLPYAGWSGWAPLADTTINPSPMQTLFFVTLWCSVSVSRVFCPALVLIPEHYVEFCFPFWNIPALGPCYVYKSRPSGPLQFLTWPKHGILWAQDRRPLRNLRQEQQELWIGFFLLITISVTIGQVSSPVPSPFRN